MNGELNKELLTSKKNTNFTLSTEAFKIRSHTTPTDSRFEQLARIADVQGQVT